MPEIKLTIAIINWNTRALLDKCLQSLYGNIPAGSGYEIIVVDNGSSDGSSRLIQDKYPGVCLIANKDNLGFACAANKALYRAQARYILFLNTDVIIPAGGLIRLLQFMEEHPRIGLCTPALCRPDGSRQKTCVSFPSLLTELLGRLPPAGGEEPCAVPSIRGACMLARREVIKKLGGFDEKYFFFLEETDLCWRLLQEGYQVWFVPAVKVLHSTGQTAARDPVSARIEFWKSRYIFFRDHYPRGRNIILRWGLGVKLIADWLINLAATVATLCLAGRFRTKFRIYSIIIWWHLRGRPGDWGLGSGNIIRKGNYRIKAEFGDWWREHKDLLMASSSRPKMIKENSSRELFLYNDRVFVKIYKKKSVFKKLWQTEWRLLNRISQLDIKTTIPIAGGPDLLVTAKIPGVLSLHEFILDHFNRISVDEKLRAISSFAGFIKKLHHKGVYHGDLHAGNILVRMTDSGYDFYITDLHRARIKLYLSRRDIINNLVQLDKFFSVTVTPAVRLRFFKYYAAGTCLQKEYRDYVRIIARKTEYACCRLWRKRDRLYFTKGKYGIRRRYRGMDYIINPVYKGIDLAQIASRIQPGYGEVIKDSRSSYLSRFYMVGVGEVVFKLYRQKRFVNYIKDLFRRSRGFRAWQGSWRLITRRINTAEPVLAGQRKRWGIIRSSFIVTRYIPDSRNLTLTARDLARGQQPELAGKLALFIGKFHDRGVFPCDLKGSNIIVAGTGRETRFYLIDTDHIMVRNKVSLQQRLYNVRQVRRSTGLFPAAALRIRNILIVKPSSLGDIMQSLPAVSLLRQYLPGARIWWLANTGYRDFLRQMPEVNGVIAFQRKRWGQATRLPLTVWEFTRFTGNLRRHRYDLGIDLQGLLRSGIITLLSGASLRLGFRHARDGAGIFYNYRVLPPPAITRAYQRYQALIDYIIPAGSWSGPGKLKIPPAIRTRTEMIWGDKNKLRVIVNPGGRWVTKRWPVDYYAELINQLAKKYNLAVILTGDQQDAGPASQIAKAVEIPVINLAGKTNLIELAAIIYGCRALVTNDSGPMHLAAYLGKPVVALFGPTDPARTGPVGKYNRIIETPVSCHPCFRRHCRHFICMKAIPVTEVLSAVEDIV